MYKLLNHHKTIYLLNIKEDIILFQTVTRIEIEGAVPRCFQYITYQGNVVNDIILGISLDYTNIDSSNIEDYKNFEKAIKNVEFITDDELSNLLPFSVCDDYPEPF